MVLCHSCNIYRTLRSKRGGGGDISRDKGVDQFLWGMGGGGLSLYNTDILKF